MSENSSNQYRREFHQGLKFARSGDWKSAVECFAVARDAEAKGSALYNYYSSFHGMALVQLGDPKGIGACRTAAGQDCENAEIFENLARAEIRLKNRRRACEAIARGLKQDKRHAGLLSLRQKLGIRRRPVFPFFSRDHVLNRFLGRLTYRRNPVAGGSAKP